MFPEFLRHKKREMKGFLHMIRGKLTSDDRARMIGANEALMALEEERDIYLKEKTEAEKRIHPDIGSYKADEHSVPEDKVMRESNNRDISAY